MTAAPAKPGAGAGSMVLCGEPGADLRHRAAAGLGDRIGNSDQRHVAILGGDGRERYCGKVAGAVEPQQRHSGGRVGGDALGVAEAGHRDRPASVGRAGRRDQIARRADHDRGRVLDRAFHPRGGAALGSGNPANVSAIATATGPMMPSVA